MSIMTLPSNPGCFKCEHVLDPKSIPFCKKSYKIVDNYLYGPTKIYCYCTHMNKGCKCELFVPKISWTTKLFRCLIRLFTGPMNIINNGSLKIK